MSHIADYTLDEFLQLPAPQVADLIRGLTLGFPIDGTRRWFLLHHPQVWDVKEYKRLTTQQYVA